MSNHTPNNFILDKTLEKDTFFACDLALSKVLVMNNKNCPWLILVPRINNVSELYQLSDKDYSTLCDEIKTVSNQMAAFFKADKMNVAALGNVVPQLHVHVIVRFKTDKAWPSPVFGRLPEDSYSEVEKKQIITEINNLLEDKII